MKKLCLIIVLVALFLSCKKDPYVDLIDTWDIEGEMGEVTFNADGTGTATLTSFDLLNDIEFGVLKNQCIESNTSTFTWTVTEQKRDKGDLEILFDNDSTCSSVSYPRYNFYPGRNQVSLGQAFVSFDIFRRK